MGELLRRCKGTLLAPGVFAGGGGVAVHTSGFLQSVAALPGAQQVPGWGKQPSGKQPTLWGSEMCRAGHSITGTCASPSEASAPAGTCAWC